MQPPQRQHQTRVSNATYHSLFHDSLRHQHHTDSVLARVVCLAYYRNINDGKPVSVKSVDIPGLSNYLLGRSLSITNIVAILTKLALLAIVLVANITISTVSKETITTPLDARFKLSPADTFIKEGHVFQVRRRPESMKQCFLEDDKTQSLTYYEIRFNLADGKELKGNDYGEAGELGKYDIDDSSVLCMKPGKVSKKKELITVIGCTKDKYAPSPKSCLNVVQERRRAPGPELYVETEEYGVTIKHFYRDYDSGEITRLFPEHKDPVFTCLSTKIGVSNTQDSTYAHCLLVAFQYDTDGVVNVTVVERWAVVKTDTEGQEDFMLEYPGIIFKDEFKLGRLGSARYLERPFSFSDYRTMSAELIAQAADYEYLGGTVEGSVGKLKTLEGSNKPLTIIPKYAIGLVVAAVAAVVFALLVTVIMLRSDKRPRFNTINGLSSIVREENTPSGSSYQAGESALLGLKFTRDDRLRFGPLEAENEATPFQAGFDLS